jgi:hypothetical protein
MRSAESCISSGGNEPTVAHRIIVKSITSVGYDLYTEAFGQPNIASPSLIRSLRSQAAPEGERPKFSPQFLYGEWSEVVDAWQLASSEAYAQVSRLGRKTRISGKQREALWAIFERVRAASKNARLSPGPVFSAVSRTN